jgi:hypothetical protein
MVDVISLLHKITRDWILWNPVIAGNNILSIQASSYHYCSPRINNLPPYMYDEYEVYIDGEVPVMVKHVFKDRLENIANIVPNVTKQELQWLYDYLCEYKKPNNV